jgi:hypothetical protein
MDADRELDLRRIRRRGRLARSPRAARRRGRDLVATRRPTADGPRGPQARSRPRRRRLRPPLRRAGVRPLLFWRQNIPETELEGIEPGSEFPGGLVALYDGRGRNETPLWLPEQRALVFADALTAPEGELLVWLGNPLARRARAPCAAGLARPTLRARDRLARRAGPRPTYVRAGARAPALERLGRGTIAGARPIEIGRSAKP